MLKNLFTFTFIFFSYSFSLSSSAQDLLGLKNDKRYTIEKVDLEVSAEPDTQNALAKGVIDPEIIKASQISFFDEKGKRWKLLVFQNSLLPNGPTLFIPHDNENDAFMAAARAMEVYGGHLLALECEEERICEGIDPNRHFLEENAMYISTIMRFYETKSFPIITLHNNHDSHRDLGGNGSIYADLPVPYADGRGIYHAGDPDDLIIYADTLSVNESLIFQRYDLEFERLRLNSIFETITPANSLGGHMSTYALTNTDKLYFNIESQHGHEDQQVLYTELLFEILGIVPIL